MRGNQEIGHAMGQHAVTDGFATVKDHGVNHAGNAPRQPTAVQRAKETDDDGPPVRDLYSAQLSCRAGDHVECVARPGANQPQNEVAGVKVPPHPSCTRRRGVGEEGRLGALPCSVRGSNLRERTALIADNGCALFALRQRVAAIWPRPHFIISHCPKITYAMSPCRCLTPGIRIASLTTKLPMLK